MAAKVRLACSFIIAAKEAVTHVPRLGLSQSIGWITRKIEKFISQNLIEEKLKIELVAGSNEEKMSTIIKTYKFLKYKKRSFSS